MSWLGPTPITTHDEYRTVEAFDLDDALERVGIAKDDPYELVEGDDFENKCFMSAITDKIL